MKGGQPMKMLMCVVGALLLCGVAFSQPDTPKKSIDDFDKTSAGQLPEGWMGGVTGQGSPKWSVEGDTTAPSQPSVLKQSGEGNYPWCVKKDVLLKDGYVEVKFKPISGNEDQAGGLVWRWRDRDNYYIARANALEDNVSIYHTVQGSRRMFKNVNMRVVTNQWHTLRVDFAGSQFKVTFDGKVAIEASDDTFKEAGAVGVWTKADSVTLFDDFVFEIDPALKNGKEFSEAQRLVEEIVAKHPKLVRLTIHAVPTGEKNNKIIACNVSEKLGKISDAEDLRVMETGIPVVLQEGDNLDVTMPILDKAGKAVAAAGITLGPNSAMSEKALTKEAEAIGRELTNAIQATKNLPW